MNNDRIYYSNESELHALRLQTMLTLSFLIIGLSIGAALALLFPPNSGKKVRKELATNIKAGLQTGRENIEPVVNRIEKGFAEIQEYVEDKLPQA